MSLRYRVALEREVGLRCETCLWAHVHPDREPCHSCQTIEGTRVGDRWVSCRQELAERKA